MNIRDLDQRISENNNDLTRGRLLTFKGGKLHENLDGLQLVMRKVDGNRYQSIPCSFNKRVMKRRFPKIPGEGYEKALSIMMIVNGFFTKDAFYEFEMDG